MRINTFKKLNDHKANESMSYKANSGQVMLFTVVLLSSSLLGSTVLVGFLMVHQVRQAGDIASSAQAIFAADAGIECARYYAPRPGDRCPGPNEPNSGYFECGATRNDSPCPDGGPCRLPNGAYYWVRWVDNGDLTNPICEFAISNGRARGVGRAFQFTLP